MNPLRPLFAAMAVSSLFGGSKEFVYPHIDFEKVIVVDHIVRPNETLSHIAFGYYDDLITEMRVTEGMNPTSMSQILVEYIGFMNDLSGTELNKIRAGDEIILPAITAELCATLFVSQDWRAIDHDVAGPKRPQSRPS